jgi:hypothetical protein
LQIFLNTFQCFELDALISSLRLYILACSFSADHELADDPDGQTEYSRKEHAKILKMKENAVLLRTMRGTLDYPGLGVGGRFFSAPYISCPGATIYDREREKGSKTSSVPASQGCSDEENTGGSGNSKAVPKHHPSPSSLQEIEDFIAKASARAVTVIHLRLFYFRLK